MAKVINEKIFTTDVLIIGSGIAGIMAAIEANKRGIGVTIVTKSALESGSSAICMGGVQAACSSLDNPDIHFKDTIVGGEYLNNKRLVRVMVDEVLNIIYELEEYGVEFVKENGNYKLFSFGGCSYPRGIVSSSPYEGGFIKPLIKETKKRNIEVLENIMITKLLKNDNGVVGAMGIDLQKEDFIIFKAKSTILATGGAGQLYPLTTNPPEVTGDGYAMAYRVGVELIDMEFIQTRACIVYPPRMVGMPPPADGLVSVGGRFYNKLGERYMKKYYSDRAENVTRAEISIATYKEIKEGRGTVHGGVYNDLSGVPDKELKRFEKFLNICKIEGINPSWQPIEWAPGTHYFMGGIKINEECQTNLLNLFAAGEVTGGIHGANRLAGNSLADCLVFGTRAGRFAAERASKLNIPSINKVEVDKEKEKILNMYRRKEGVNALDIRERIRKIMWDYVYIIRNEGGLKEAITKLKELKSIVPKFYIPQESWEKIRYIIEVTNLLDVGLIVATSALKRAESRGAHYREDYPTRDDKNWLKNIIIQCKNGEPHTYTQSIIEA